LPAQRLPGWGVPKYAAMLIAGWPVCFELLHI
jgi:hypothetical protein